MEEHINYYPLLNDVWEAYIAAIKTGAVDDPRDLMEKMLEGRRAYLEALTRLTCLPSSALTEECGGTSPEHEPSPHGRHPHCDPD